MRSIAVSEMGLGCHGFVLNECCYNAMREDRPKDDKQKGFLIRNYLPTSEINRKRNYDPNKIINIKIKMKTLSIERSLLSLPSKIGHS